MISEITRRWIDATADLERRHAAKGRRILDTIGDNPDGGVAEKVAEHETTAADCDLLLTHSHGRQAAERLHKSLYRIGFPVFDRVGNSHRLQVGYRGTRQLIFELANTMIDQIHHHGPDSWPLTPEARKLLAGSVDNATTAPGTTPSTAPEPHLSHQE